MERIYYLLKQSLFIKLALVTALVVGGGSTAWGDTVYFDGSADITGWTKNGVTYASYGNPPYLRSSNIGNTLTSDAKISFSTLNNLVINAKYYSSSNTQIVVKRRSSENEEWEIYTTISIIGTAQDYEITGLVGDYQIQLQCDNVYIYTLKLVDLNPYPSPADFIISSVNATSATFAWTAGNGETAWQFAYSNDPDFSPGIDGTTLNITANPYTLSNLTTGISYYAAIRADYGNGNYSEWTEKIGFVPRNETDLTINDGGSTTKYAPIYGGNASKLTNTQVIIPASDLTSIQNRQITKLTYYSSNSSVSWGNATYEVYMKVTNTNAFTSNTPSLESWGITVFNAGKLSVSEGKMTVILDTPFNYISGNLMIGFKQITTGTNSEVTWLASGYVSGIGMYSYGSSSGKVSYSPKITITTVASTTAPVKIDGNGYTTFASTYPLDLTSANLPSGLKAYKAAVNGEKVNFTEINQAVPANTGVLLAGTAGKTYFIPVADSGTAPDGNEFLVNSAGGTFTAESGNTYYGMLKNSDPLTFGVFDPSTVAIPSNKAYLKVSSSAARVLTSSFFDETTTGIMETRTESIDRLTTTKVFNLAGQQIANPTKGLYIINGKKHIIK